MSRPLAEISKHYPGWDLQDIDENQLMALHEQIPHLIRLENQDLARRLAEVLAMMFK